METSDGIGEKARPALCITMKLPAITQFLLTVAAGHYIVKLLGNEPPRHTKHDAAAHFFKKPRRARARRQKIRARSAALFFHGGISDQHRPDIGAGLGDHQHPDQRDGIAFNTGGAQRQRAGDRMEGVPGASPLARRPIPPVIITAMMANDLTSKNLRKKCRSSV